MNLEEKSPKVKPYSSTGSHKILCRGKYYLKECDDNVPEHSCLRCCKETRKKFEPYRFRYTETDFSTKVNVS